MKILIAGAGIGGLTAALCLEKAGHEVFVFEKASTFLEIGAGIQCGANAITVFDWLGLLPALEPLSVAPKRVDFCDYRSGNVLYSSPWGADYQAKYGQPYWHLHRADLHRVLVEAFQGKIYFNAKVSHYKESHNEVELELTDQRKFSGDLLVGADGIKSAVRSRLLDNKTLSNKEPFFTGNVAWRGVIPTSDLPDNFMETIARNFMGQGKHMVIYYLRGKQLLNFVGVVKSKQTLDESWVNEGSWEALKADFDGWHPTVQTVVDAMQNKPCYRWALYNHAPLKTWSSNRVTLLGDAAHATLPFMASGAAMAIEDARVLQRSLELQPLSELQRPLDQSKRVSEGLRCYERNRLSRTAKIQADSTKFGKLYHVQNPFALKLAFKALHSIAKRKEDFLPSYNANSVELI